MRTLIIIALLVSACGAELKHSGNVKATVSLDEKIEKYFEASCRKSLPPGTPDEYVQQCKEAAIGEFLATIAK